MYIVERIKYFMIIKLRMYKWFIKSLFDPKQADKYRMIKDYSPIVRCFGNKNPKEWIYIARKFSQGEGHGSMLITMLGHCALAERLGMIPVIDMKNYYSELWQSKEQRGKENAWEYFYFQPTECTLCEAYASKKVLLSDGGNAKFYPSYRRTFNSEKEIKFWANIYKKFIHINIYTQTRIDQISKEIDFFNKRLIAVSIRRGIEWGHKIGNKGFSWHCKVPDLQEIIKKTKELKQKWNCDGIFLVIDDNEGVEEFKNAFSGEVYYIRRKRWNYFVNGKPNPNAEIVSQDNRDIYEKEIKYLAELHLMSKCSCFIGTRSSTSLIAMIIKERKYENMFLFEEM